MKDRLQWAGHMDKIRYIMTNKKKVFVSEEVPFGRGGEQEPLGRHLSRPAEDPGTEGDRDEVIHQDYSGRISGPLS